MVSLTPPGGYPSQTAHGLLMRQELEVLVEGRIGSGLARRYVSNGGRSDC
jgi:hypothetical protein